jgi:1-deoxy-D-xylulose-5-phosphate reductoisomerase
VVGGIAGVAGLRPLWRALNAGKHVAVANKEPLVAAGELLMAKVREQGVHFLPIDSEHSALFQCLRGEDPRHIARLWLTASGGPFRTLSWEELETVTVEQALQHPTWRMGPKVTIDSATLMNKGLEVIEAHWLFGVPVERIHILIHPQSTVHSLVEFVDGSLIAQMDRPDMRNPIQFALTYPERWPTSRPRLDLTQLRTLTFEPPDFDRFPCPLLAYEAARIGGTMPAVLNAANEVAVARFLSGEMRFTDIPRLVEAVMAQHHPQPVRDLETVLAADAWARRIAQGWNFAE